MENWQNSTNINWEITTYGKLLGGRRFVMRLRDYILPRDCEFNMQDIKIPNMNDEDKEIIGGICYG